MSGKFEGKSLVGGRLGQFEVREEIARGGMGVVYKGYQSSLDRWVAIKTLPIEMAGDRELVSRFHREAEAMKALNHANVVQIIDRGQDQGHYYFAMEYIEGPSVKDMLKSPTLEMGKIFDILIQTCEGLDYAHKKGVVHRDVKPANLLYEAKTGTVKIADFGIARLIKKDADMLTLTSTGVGMGTMNYMAPEQKTDAKDVDHRADIYALGVIVYEAFTGKLPLGKFKLPTEVNAGLPRKLDDLVQKCLEAEPQDRYQSCTELKNALLEAKQAAAAGGTLVRAVRDAAERTMTAFGPNRAILLVVVAIVGLVVLVGGGAAIAAYVRSHTKPPEPVPPDPKPPEPKPPEPKPPEPKPPEPKPPEPKPPEPKPPEPKPPEPKPPEPRPEISDAARRELVASRERALTRKIELEEAFDAAAPRGRSGAPAGSRDDALAAYERARSSEASGQVDAAARDFATATDKIEQAKLALLDSLREGVETARGAAKKAGAESWAAASFGAATQAAQDAESAAGKAPERVHALVRAIEAWERAAREAKTAVADERARRQQTVGQARAAAKMRQADATGGFEEAVKLVEQVKAMDEASPEALVLLQKARDLFDEAQPPAPFQAKLVASLPREQIGTEGDVAPLEAIAANDEGVFVLAGGYVYMLTHDLRYLTQKKLGDKDRVSGLTAARRSVIFFGCRTDEGWEVKSLRVSKGDLEVDKGSWGKSQDPILDISVDGHHRLFVLTAKVVHVFAPGHEVKHLALSGDFAIPRAIAALDDGRFAVTVNPNLAGLGGDEPRWPFRVLYFSSDEGRALGKYDGPTQISAVAQLGPRLIGVDHQPLSANGGGLFLFPPTLEGEPARLVTVDAARPPFEQLALFPMRLAVYGKRAYVLDKRSETAVCRARIALFDLK